MVQAILCLVYITILQFFFVAAFGLGIIIGLFTKSQGVHRALKSFARSIVVAFVLCMLFVGLATSGGCAIVDIHSLNDLVLFIVIVAILSFPFIFLIYLGVYFGVLCKNLVKSIIQKFRSIQQ